MEKISIWINRAVPESEVDRDSGCGRAVAGSAPLRPALAAPRIGSAATQPRRPRSIDAVVEAAGGESRGARVNGWETWSQACSSRRGENNERITNHGSGGNDKIRPVRGTDASKQAFFSLFIALLFYFFLLNFILLYGK